LRKAAHAYLLEQDDEGDGIDEARKERAGEKNVEEPKSHQSERKQKDAHLRHQQSTTSS
jgi:hypothetical protein